MELHRVIFRLDFSNAFSIFTRWGEILSYLDASKTWTELGDDISRRSISAVRSGKEKSRSHLLNVTVNDIDGSFEDHPMTSLKDLEEPLRQVDYIRGLLEIEQFKRVGVRFFFLSPCDSFEQAFKAYRGQVTNHYWESFENAVTDISVVSVHKSGEQNLRFTTGPVRKGEHANFFIAHEGIKHENAFLFDLDFFTKSYRAEKFDLNKLVTLYYSLALAQVDRVQKALTEEH